MLIVASISIDRNDPPARLARMVPPVVSRLSECGHFLRLVSEESEQGNVHGDGDFVTLFIPEIDADKALAVVVDEGSEVHGVGAQRREISVAHNIVLRGGLRNATIAETGDVGSIPGEGPGESEAA